MQNISLKNVKHVILYFSGKKLADGKSLTGRGRLTLGRIDSIQNFYGKAIRNNTGDVEAMSEATMAILYHYSSTSEDPQHDHCPEGVTSWCSWQRDQATGGTDHRPIQNPFTPAMVDVLKPTFETLSAPTLLAGCVRGMTQNANESLHHLAWGLIPKEAYHSPYEVATGLCMGIMLFNRGHEAANKLIFEAVGLKCGQNGLSIWQAMDVKRIRWAEHHASEETRVQRKKQRASNLRKDDTFKHKEGTEYQAGAFYGDASTSTDIAPKSKRRRKTSS